MIPAVRVLRPCPVRSSFPAGLTSLVAALCPGPGWGGPRPDMAVAAEHAAGNAGVRAGSLQAPHRFGADADHVVAVADRVSGGLDPGHPRVPGPVPLMLLPAQQMPDPVPGQLHDRRRPRLAAIQLPTLSSHTPKIRNDVLYNKRPRADPAIRRSAQRGINTRPHHARPTSRPALRCRRMKTQATWLAVAPGTWSRPSRADLTRHSSRRKTRPWHPTPSGEGITALSGPAGARLTRRMITVLGRGTISWPGNPAAPVGRADSRPRSALVRHGGVHVLRGDGARLPPARSGGSCAAGLPAWRLVHRYAPRRRRMRVAAR
jgi:hypothetical protein